MKTFSALLFALAVAVPAAAQTPAPAADVVGTWDVTVTTQQGRVGSAANDRQRLVAARALARSAGRYVPTDIVLDAEPG